MVKKITKNWTNALLNMKVSEVVEFPLEKLNLLLVLSSHACVSGCGERNTIGRELESMIGTKAYSILKE